MTKMVDNQKQSKRHGLVQTSHKTSMSFWIEKIREVSKKNDVFARDLLVEEVSKTNRLSEMSSGFGLPIYETYNFILPNEVESCRALCNDRKKNGWKLSLRFSDLQGQLIFRHLDMDLDDVMAAIENLEHLDRFEIRVDPYKIPTISGTIWVRHGDVHLELVCGPHKWLTKAAPQANSVFSCSYNYLSVKYSTDDLNTRRILFRCLKDVVRITLGLNIRQLPEIQQSVYAEFHWHKSLGYRFLECSFSSVWTGVMLMSDMPLLSGD